MIDNNQTILLFIKQLQKIPYLACKNLYVVAQYFLDLEKQEADNLCSAIKNLKENTQKCDICFIWKERNKDCSICSSKRRDQETVCIVETWRDLIAIEKTGSFSGQYHILGGSICPLEGISPQDLTINPLINRIKNGSFKEIIFALNQTPEGEATATYIVSKIKQLIPEKDNITISCIARGLPVGATLEYMDRLTVSKAVVERRHF